MMDYVEASNGILKNYGIMGLVLVAIVIGGAWFVYKVVSHFIKQTEQFNESNKQRDEQILNLSEKFADAINKVMQTLNSEREVHFKLVESFNAFSERNKSEHQEILQKITIRKTRAHG